MSSSDLAAATGDTTLREVPQEVIDKAVMFRFLDEIKAILRDGTITNPLDKAKLAMKKIEECLELGGWTPTMLVRMNALHQCAQGYLTAMQAKQNRIDTSEIYMDGFKELSEADLKNMFASDLAQIAHLKAKQLQIVGQFITGVETCRQRC